MDQNPDPCLFWGVTGRGAGDTRRVAVDLGLRSALLAYGDMSVPGIAGASFVRQLVWPCMALAVEAAMPGRRGPVPKARLATAIEALSSKLYLADNPDASSETHMGRVAGIRSLPTKGWSFDELGPSQGFVSNPRRRAATRALPEQGGLGLATGASRLEGMHLTTLGRELTDAVHDAPAGHGTVGSWLTKWPHRTDRPTEKTRRQLAAALGPFDPTERERHAVMVALMRVEKDDGRRKRLIELLSEIPERVDIDVETDVLVHLPERQADEIRAAWAFRRLLTAGQRLLRAAASGLRAPDVRQSIDSFIADGGGAVVQRTRDAARTFLESIEGRPELGRRDATDFAAALVEGDDRSAVVEVVRRAQQLIAMDRSTLRQGPGWTPGWLDAHDILDPESETEVVGDLPPRFRGLIGLLRDCGRLRA